MLSWNWRHTFYFAVLNGSYYEYGSWHIYASEIGVLLLLIIKSVQGWRGAMKLWWPLVVLAAWSLLSATWSVSPEVSLVTGLHVILAMLFTLYLVEIDPRQVVVPLLSGLAVQAGIGIIQFVRNSDMGLRLIGEPPLDPRQGGIAVIVHDGLRQLRSYALTQHPNIFGGLLAIAYPLILTTRSRWWMWGGGLLAVIGVALSFSRNGWLVWLVVLGAVLWLGDKQIRRWAGIGLLVFVTILGLHADVVTSRVMVSGSLEERSVVERVEGLGEWNRVWGTHKWLGVGAGAYTSMLAGLNPDLNAWDYRPVHNIFLLIAGELGLIGLILFLVLIVTSWHWSLELVHKPGGLIWILPWWGLLAMGVFDHWVWSTVQGRLYLFVALALLFSAKKISLESYGIRGIRHRGRRGATGDDSY